MSTSPTPPRLSRRIGMVPAVEHGLPPLNIFRTLAHDEKLLEAFLQLGGHLLRTGALPSRERELVILRVGWRAGSEYEFGQHTAIGRAAGLAPEELARVADADHGTWSADDQTLIDLVDELCDDDLVSDPTWARLAQRWSEPELLELLVLAGFYRLVSGLLNSAGVALEAGAAGWPERAAARRTAPRDQS